MEILLLNSRSCVDICGRRRFRGDRSWLYRVSTRVPAQPAPEPPQSKVVSLAVCGGFFEEVEQPKQKPPCREGQPCEWISCIALYRARRSLEHSSDAINNDTELTAGLKSVAFLSFYNRKKKNLKSHFKILMYFKNLELMNLL